MKMIFDNVLLHEPLPVFFSSSLGDFSQSPLTLLNILIISIIVIAFIRGIFYYYQQLLTARAGQQLISKIRIDLYAHIYSLPFSFHNKTRVGELLVHLIGDMRVLRDILISLPAICTREILLMVGMSLVMFVIDWQLTLVAFLIVPVLIFYLQKYQTSLNKEIKNQRDREGDLTAMAAEIFDAIKIVQGFHQEGKELKKISRQSRRSLRSSLKASSLLAKLRRASDLGVAVISAFILALAGKQVLDGFLTPGDILVFVYYLRAFNKPLKKISMISEKLTRGIVSGRRIAQLMDTESEIREAQDSIQANPFRGTINFQNVSYMYQPGFPVLTDINLKIKSGERVAIIGPSGSGKSTLVSLIPRFYDPSSGQVLIDNCDIRRFTLASLRNQVSFVFQEPVLFATSIAENIAYGSPGASLNDIKQAAEKANLHQIIESLPEGYGTIVGERGCALSGGQRQCIAIARAMIKNAPIVILDEPLSGLGIASTKLVMKALQVLLEGKTVILITHQRESIGNMDRTIELHYGTIRKEFKHESPFTLDDLHPGQLWTRPSPAHN